MSSLLQDVRYALRILAKSPAFTAVAVLTLALGIGANTAIFSLIDAVMLHSLPVKNPNQLVILQWKAHKFSVDGEYSSFGDCGESGISGPSGCSFPLPIFRAIQSQTNAFSGVLACAGPAALNLSGNGPPSIAGGEIVSGDYFSTLSVNAAIGRTLGPSDDSPSAWPAAVLSYAYWQSAFGGSRSVIGRTILLNRVAFTIVGVAEPSFTNLSPGKSQDLWLTIAMMPRLQIDWGSHIEGMSNWWLLVLGRLEPGVSLFQAQAAASLVFRNEVVYGPKPLAKPENDPEITLTRAQEGLVGERGQISKILYLLTFAVGIILMIVCANVAGLLLSRAASRQKEMAVRFALGAGRGTVLRQLLTESVLLSFLGGILGIVFAYWGVHAFTALIARSPGAHFAYVTAPDWRVLAVALGICILTGIIFGLAPAFRSARVDLTPALKEDISSLLAGSARAGRFHLGNALVAAQVALSVVVLIGAGLLVRTLENLRNINLGFDARNVLTFQIDPTLLGYKDAQMENLYSQLRARLAALPGVTSVSYSSDELVSGGQWTESIRFEGRSRTQSAAVDMLAAGPSFFETMRIPLVEGRMFAPADFEQAQRTSAAKAAAQNAKSPTGATAVFPAATAPQLQAPVSVLVNEAFVRQYFAKESPLVKGIWKGGGSGSGATGGSFGEHYDVGKDWQIVGVVGDTKYDTLRGKIQPIIYLPFTSGGGYFELRTAADPRALIPSVRSVANAIDSNVPLTHMRTQAQAIDEQMSQERLIARVSGFFGILALALACVGLYGLLAYEVSRRTRDIGIRMALGADRRTIFRFVIGQGLWLTVVGLAIGVAAALVVNRLMVSFSHLLYGVGADDPLTFVSVAILLMLVALAACWIPARRAMKADPMVALRHE